MSVQTTGRVLPMQSMILVGEHAWLKRMIDPVGNQGHVERKVSAQAFLRPPADASDVWTGQHLPARLDPLSRGVRSRWAAHQDQRPLRERSGQGIEQVPVDLILERPDVTKQGTRTVGQVRRRIRADRARADR
ncbi:MAG: hypothetical protein U0794_13975 [Isosphaeraceae bacterium]